MVKKIFFSIAAYREDELIPTVNDAILKADNPQNLVFGIFDQNCRDGIKEHSEGFNALDLKGAEIRIRFHNFEIVKGGLGWARYEAQKLYDEEDFVFQIDSHLRFIKSWDTVLLNMYNSIPSDNDKRIMSSYPPGYLPPNRILGPNYCYRIGVHPFQERDKLFPQNKAVSNIDKYDVPQLGFCTAGGYVFGKGSWIHDVPADPNLYFGLDEPSMAFRSWTAGYDIYYPIKTILFHYYGRKTGKRHWNDHVYWQKLDKLSRQHFFNLLEGKVEKFGFGKERFFEDFFEFSGINWYKKTITEKASLGFPNIPEHEHKGSLKEIQPRNRS